jgi:hypothetical protein
MVTSNIIQLVDCWGKGAVEGNVQLRTANQLFSVQEIAKKLRAD